MRRTYRTLNDCEMQHNAEVGLFTKPSILYENFPYPLFRKNVTRVLDGKLEAGLY